MKLLGGGHREEDIEVREEQFLLGHFIVRFLQKMVTRSPIQLANAITASYLEGRAVIQKGT